MSRISSIVAITREVSGCDNVIPSLQDLKYSELCARFKLAVYEEKHHIR